MQKKLTQKIKNENELRHKKYHVRKHLIQHEIITFQLNHHIKKKKKNVFINKIAVSIFSVPFKIVKVQLTNFTTAGNEIITVTVLYKDLLL